MSASEALPLQTLSLFQFHQLQQLIQGIAQTVDALLLTDRDLSAPLPEGPEEWLLGLGLEFMLVISVPFSALLWARPLSPVASSCSRYQVGLSFDPISIRSTIDSLCHLATERPLLPEAIAALLAQRRHQPQANDPTLQSQLLLALLRQVQAEPSPGAIPADPMVGLEDSGSAEDSGSDSDPTPLSEIDQERLQYQVITQIRQSLELPVILQTAVEQARQFLQTDRLVIYRFDQELPPDLSPATACAIDDRTQLPIQQSGSVIYEARASEQIPSVLNFVEAHCFVHNSRYHDLTRQELAIAIEDVAMRYATSPCLLTFLRQAQITAKLVAPILIRDQLWGLLIAHQCGQPRHWHETEQRFLRHIAEHLGLAISHARLYTEVLQQQQTLEQRVIERTQELHDVMQAAQAANRAKSEFLAAVSHELRTPLTCIIGMSATLNRWSNTLSDRQQRFLQSIQSSGEQLLALINDILDVSQVEAGKVILNLSEFSLGRLAQQTVKAFEGQAALNEVGLEVDVRVAPEADRFVADPRRVKQILFNLLDNAIKFTPPGGNVTLRVWVEVDMAVFWVKDQGIGIPQEQLPDLFEKFRQLSSGHRRQYRGTGIGLALTKQYVELHGGSISVESTVGVGSVFTVRLPRQRFSAAQSPATTRTNAIVPTVKGRIVLIEPQEAEADLICDVLTAAGYQVVWMLEGSSAVNQIEILQPAAIITNVQLPDIDGYSLIHNLQQNPATKNLKVIALIPSRSPTAGTTQTSDRSADSESHPAIDYPSPTPEPSLEEAAPALPTETIDKWQLVGASDVLEYPVRPDRLLQKIMALAITQG